MLYPCCTKVLAYDFSQLLVEIGSSLGLWLGLSVVGMFDLVVLMALKIEKLCIIAAAMLVKLKKENIEKR